MKPYIHKVQYYETDRMGITHHSNYIRWMEEARMDFLDQIGWGYEKMEEQGIISPVLSVSCKYKQSTTFADEVSVEVKIEEFNGIRLILEYTMKKVKDGEIVLIGTTEHCFLNAQSHPIRFKKELPDLYEILVKISQDSK